MKKICVEDYLDSIEKKEIVDQIRRLAKEHSEKTETTIRREIFSIRKTRSKSPGSPKSSRSPVNERRYPPPMCPKLLEIENLQYKLEKLGVPFQVCIEAARASLNPNSTPYQMSF